ncbi:MAG: hypothetical protein ACRCUY_01995, partial [Thermoguttaceae bacterium]
PSAKVVISNDETKSNELNDKTPVDATKDTLARPIHSDNVNGKPLDVFRTKFQKNIVTPLNKVFKFDKSEVSEVTDKTPETVAVHAPKPNKPNTTNQNVPVVPKNAPNTPNTPDVNTAATPETTATKSFTYPSLPNVPSDANTTNVANQNKNQVIPDTNAPLPPDDIEYLNLLIKSVQEKTASQSETRTNKSEADSPHPAKSNQLTQEKSPAKKQEPGSLSTYSFDTRDWVDYFPIDNISASSRTEPSKSAPANKQQSAQSNPSNTSTAESSAVATSTNVAPQQPAESATKVASASLTPSPISHPQIAPVQLTASRMPASIPADIKSNPSNNEIFARSANPAKQIDLSPSYQKQLKYTEICGVVVVQSNFPLTEISAILEEIKGLQNDLHRYMGIPAPKEKIELCLFDDERSYLQFLKSVFPEAPRDRRALYIKMDGKPGTLLVQKTNDFEIDLRHEMTHAIIHASIAVVPIWLDEGLAKYFEVPISDRAEKNPYMKQIRWNLRFGAVPSLSYLESLEDIGEMGSREYRDSWAWVHFLIHHSPQTHRLLAGYLQLLAKRESSETETLPTLGIYLTDVVSTPREQYRRHFSEAYSSESRDN